jgi:hypothetical protein
VIEFVTTFSLAAAGSLVGLSADLVLNLVAGNGPRNTITTGAVRGESTESARPADPVTTFGFILISYGIIALALTTALPGPLALERTGLTFALLCVGGLIGEISRTGSTTQLPNLDADDRMPAQRKPISLRLSLALMLIFNLSFAVLSTGRGLIEIVPPKPASARHIQELEPMLVVARRTHDPLEDHSAPF